VVKWLEFLGAALATVVMVGIVGWLCERYGAGVILGGILLIVVLGTVMGL